MEYILNNLQEFEALEKLSINLLLFVLEIKKSNRYKDEENTVH